MQTVYRHVTLLADTTMQARQAASIDCLHYTCLMMAAAVLWYIMTCITLPPLPHMPSQLQTVHSLSDLVHHVILLISGLMRLDSLLRG